MSAYYFLPRGERPRETVLNILLFTSVVGAIAWTVLAFFPGVLVTLFQDPELLRYAPWIGLVIFVGVVGSFLEIVTVANQEMKMATVVITLAQFTRAAFFVSAAIWGGTIGALIAAAIVQGILQIAVLLVYLNSRFPRFWRAFDAQTFRAQLAYALPLGAAGLLYTLQNDLHNYFMSHRFSAATFAIYSIGAFQIPLLGILSESVGSVLIPRVSSLQHQGHSREILLLTARAVRKLAAFYFPLYAFLLVVRHEFITGLFTSQYAASVPIFTINLTLIPLGILIVDPIIRAYAQHRHFVLKLQIVLLTAMLFTLWFALDRYGARGAISTVVVFTALQRAALLFKVRRILNVTVRDLVLFRDVVKLAVAAAVAGLATLPLRTVAIGFPPLVSVALCGLGFGTVYLLVVLSLRIITADERDVVLRTLGLAGGAPRTSVSPATN